MTSPSRLVARTRPWTSGARLADLFPDTNPYAWIRGRQGVIGWGVAARFTGRGPDRMSAAAQWWRQLSATIDVDDRVRRQGTGPLVFGSFAFSDDSDKESVLVLPHVIIGRDDDGGWMTVISSQDTPGTVDGLPKGEYAFPHDDSAGTVTCTPGKQGEHGWSHVIERGLDAISAGHVRKVVLARHIEAQATGEIDPRILLDMLTKAYFGCWSFSVDGLVGATPELLIGMANGVIHSRVLAGTRGYDLLDPDAETALGYELQHSEKDLQEHRFAAESVVNALTPLCDTVDSPAEPHVLTLPGILHLASDIYGHVGSGAAAKAADGKPVSSLEVAEKIHPSAAVCGTPRDAAAALLRDLEGCDRGRYSGPVGWMDADGNGEWGIALRCAQLSSDHHAATLYAGGGIVAGSDPLEEFHETEAKFQPMFRALGVA